MRADGRKYEMGRRFAIVIGVAATGVMALGAQTVAGVVKHDAAEAKRVHRVTTRLEIGRNGGDGFYGQVYSARKCQGGRQVTLFKQRPGADHRLGATRSQRFPYAGSWRWHSNPRVLHHGDRVYAKVRRERHRLFVCAADRSKAIPTDGGSI